MGMILDYAGAGIKAFGTYEQGQAQAHAATYNAQVAKNNANYASEAGSSQAVTESLKGAATGANIKVSQAANGVNVNTGSAVKVQQGAREAGTLDTQTVENNALLTAYGYQEENKLKTLEAKQATVGADLGAAGGLLSDISAIDQKWASMAASGGGG